jgi:hypothetical protein
LGITIEKRKTEDIKKGWLGAEGIGFLESSIPVSYDYIANRTRDLGYGLDLGIIFTNGFGQYEGSSQLMYPGIPLV